jgi:hypothetical protein
MITCNKCKTDKVVAYDNDPLSFDEEWLLSEPRAQYDSSIYMHFKCLECDNKFGTELEIT